MKKLILLLCLLVFRSPAHADQGAPFDLVFEADDGVPIVNLSVAFRAGAVSDPQEYLGLTNFMSEMLLRGTRQRNKHQLELKIDEFGSNIGMDVRNQMLIVRAAVLASQVQPFLNLLSEIILQPSFPESEIKKLKSQFISELMAQRSNDNSLVKRQFTKFLFGKHPLGRPVTGDVSTVKRFTRALLLKQYRDVVQSAGMVIAATGDVNPQVLQDWGAHLAAQLPRKEQLENHTLPDSSTRPRALIIDKPDRTQHPILIGQIGLPYRSPEFVPLYLGNYGFGGESFNSRLMQEIRVKRGWSYGAYSRLRPSIYTGEWSMGYSPATKDVAPALQEGIHMVKDLKEKGLNRGEFEFSKDALINNSGFLYNTPAKRIENALIERFFKLPDGFIRNLSRDIGKLSREDVNSKLKSFLDPQSFALVTIGSPAVLRKPVAEALGISESEVKVKKYTED
jgi:zinc protease